MDNMLYGVMPKRIFDYLLNLLLLIGFTAFLTSCDNDEKRGEEGNEEEVYGSDRLIYALFPPRALGDHSVNDLQLEGILRARQNLKFDVMIYSPQNMKDAEVMLELCVNMIKSNETGQNLLLLCGQEYEAPLINYLTENEWNESKASDIILLETNNTSLPITTFEIDYYEVSYIAGAIASLFAEKAAIIEACPGMQLLDRAAQGFSDGWNENQTTPSPLPIAYISDSYEGFSMTQRARQLADSLHRKEEVQFIYPLAGYSNQGIYQYTRQTMDSEIYTSGMDVNLSSYSARIVFSVVKQLDQLLESYIQAWWDQKEMPLHATYGLKDGYADIALVEEYEESYRTLVAYYKEVLTEKQTKTAAYEK